jgi:hypothetical protein
MELHAKTSIRDTCFFFRIKRSQTTAAAAAGSVAQGSPASVRYIYG